MEGGRGPAAVSRSRAAAAPPRIWPGRASRPGSVGRERPAPARGWWRSYGNAAGATREFEDGGVPGAEPVIGRDDQGRNAEFEWLKPSRFEVHAEAGCSLVVTVGRMSQP